MNNDTNNNLNGTVLGNVDNSSAQSVQPSIDNNIETLDLGTTEVNQNLGNNTFFNQPINNEATSQVGEQMVMEQPINQSQSQVIGTNSQVIEPTPAYTNPQTIMQTSMPGIENSNVIGTTPPISLEPEKQPQKKNSGSKVLFVIIILIVLAGVGFGTYYVLNYTDLLKNSEQVTIKTKDLEINIGDKLSTDISDYATISGTDTRNCSINTVEVDINKEGNYKYTVVCGETEKMGNIAVITKEEFDVGIKTVYKVKGETLLANEFAKEESAEIDYKFVDEENVKNLLNSEVGTYSVKLKVSNGKKEIEKDANLVILEHPIKGHLICTSNEQNVENVSAKMTVSEKFTIVEDGNYGYGKIAYEVHNFVFSDETEYTSYYAKYKTDKEITINNIKGETEFDDSNLTITISNKKDNTIANNEYGESNMLNYSSIKNYFTKTLGYNCIYQKVN